jgi:DNA-directed RNA polymerase beta' subunit
MPPKKVSRTPKGVVATPGQLLSRTHGNGTVANRDEPIRFQTKAMRKSKTVLGRGHATSITGSVMSAQEIREMSVCDLSQTEGDESCLEDLRMGPRNPNERCSTCSCAYGVCNGHYSRLELPSHAWFAHPFYVNDGTLPAIMNLFCYGCFLKQAPRLLDENVALPSAVMLFDRALIRSLESQYKQYKYIERLKVLASEAKPMACRDGCAITFFKKTKDLTINLVDYKNPKDVKALELDGSTIYYFLKSISNYLTDNQLHSFIGFSPIQYENFVVTVIPVLPTASRPAIIVNGEKQESDFTALYWTMIVIIREMRIHANVEPKLIELRKTLRETYYAYINSETKISLKGRSKKTGDALKTMSKQLDGKQGLLHKNIYSSRVDNSGRTVVAANNSIKPGQVSVPFYMADRFRIKLEITARNLSVAQDLLRKGIIKTIARNSGANRPAINEITDELRQSLQLQIGDVVYRRMVTGDIVIINRQPTLHRYSIMAMKAVVNEGEMIGREVNVVGMNTIGVSGFNMDFDGDEVHLHVPDTIEARAEALALMSIERAPVSDQTSQNIFGLIQNTVWGAYSMTKNPKNLSQGEWMRMASGVEDFEGDIPGGPKDYDLLERVRYIRENLPRIYARNKVKGLGIWNTLSLISLAFPPDYSYRKAMGDDAAIYIDQGILISGTFTKSITGAGPGSIIQDLFEKKGPTAIVIYGHVMQQVIALWMDTQGKTISITDYAPNATLSDQLETMKDERLRGIKEIGQGNVEGIFNRKLFLINIKDTWMKQSDIPVVYHSIMGIDKAKREQLYGRLLNEIAFVLFDYMQLEKNTYVRGRSDQLFKPERVTEALVRAVGNIIETPGDILKKPLKPGELFKVSARTQHRSAEEIAAETQLIIAFRQYVLEKLNDPTISFIQDQMKDPFSDDNVSTRSVYENATIEASVLDAMDLFRGELLKITSNTLDPKGSLAELTKSGARGNPGNIVNSITALGQQTMNDARLKESISGGTRVTPFFMENDPDAMARGYIRSSLFRGMGPAEFISAAMPARQTQTDTAFKTGETGYMQKLLMAACGDFVVFADGTVRDERGQIVSYLYGMDPSRVTRVGDGYLFADIHQLAQQAKAESQSTMKTKNEYFKKF